jgi:hypothetical protein
VDDPQSRLHDYLLLVVLDLMAVDEPDGAVNRFRAETTG